MTGPLTNPTRVGEVRPSQLMYAYGIGAIVDLPKLSVIVTGLEDWPTDRPASGLAFLGRPAQPTGGLEALWAASAQELTAVPADPGQGKPAGGIQPCVSCGLSLSANARFCRRCGARQG